MQIFVNVCLKKGQGAKVFRLYDEIFNPEVY